MPKLRQFNSFIWLLYQQRTYFMNALYIKPARLIYLLLPICSIKFLQHHYCFNEKPARFGFMQGVSGTQSPTLGKAIGLGYVKTEFSAIGSEIYIGIRNQAIKASVVKTPFL